MFNAHKVGLRGLAVLTVFAMVLAAQPLLGAVIGYNEFLEQSDGRAFIPHLPQTSGWLGEEVNGRIVGARPETFQLNGKGAAREGYLKYNLFFDMETFAGPDGQPIAYDPALVITSTMDLTLDLFNLAFQPRIGRSYIYTEVLTLTFLRNYAESESGPSLPLLRDYNESGAGPSLTIDINNYRDFGPEGLETTALRPVTYVINLEQDIGLTADDFQQIFDDMAFTLNVEIRSRIERTAPGVGTYRNEAEFLGNYGATGEGFFGAAPANPLTFDLVPEPLTLALLGVGSIVLLRRRSVTAR